MKEVVSPRVADARVGRTSHRCPLENQQNHHRCRRRPSPSRPRRRHLLEGGAKPATPSSHKSPPQVRYRRLPAQSRSPPRPPLRTRHHLRQGPSLFNRSQRDAHQERRWLWSMASQSVSRAIGSSAPRGFGHRAPLHAGRQHRVKGCGTSSAEVRYFACRLLPFKPLERLLVGEGHNRRNRRRPRSQFTGRRRRSAWRPRLTAGIL